VSPCDPQGQGSSLQGPGQGLDVQGQGQGSSPRGQGLDLQRQDLQGQGQAFMDTNKD